MATMTTTTGDKFIPELWLDEVRRALEAELIIKSKFKSFAHEGKAGDLLHIPDVSDLNVKDMTQSGEVNPEAISETEFTLTIDKWKEASFLIKDLLKVQNRYDLRNEYTHKAGYAIAKQIETDLATQLVSTSFNQYNGDGTAVTGAGAAITRAGILKAIQDLDEANAPQGDRVLLVPPFARNTMLQIDQFTSIDYVNKRPTVTKKIGEIFGLEVYVSNLLQATVVSSTTRMNAIVAHKDAVVIAMQQAPRVQAEYQLQKLANLVVIDAVYGVGVFRSTNAIKLRMNTTT